MAKEIVPRLHYCLCDTDLLTVAASVTKADFLDPILLLRTDRLPDVTQWQYEVDGNRAIAFKSGGKGPYAFAER